MLLEWEGVKREHRQKRDLPLEWGDGDRITCKKKKREREKAKFC